MTATETQSENPDLHELLVVSEDATIEEIKEAYKKMVFLYPPNLLIHFENPFILCRL